MNTNFKIQRAFNTHKKSTIENVYVPKIKSTVNVSPGTFNEIAKNIAKQLKPKTLKQLKNI